jgi:hypothetical protein
MSAQPKLKARRKTLSEALRSARYWAGVVIENYPGTTPEQPWGVVAPAPANPKVSSRKAP